MSTICKYATEPLQNKRMQQDDVMKRAPFKPQTFKSQTMQETWWKHGIGRFTLADVMFVPVAMFGLMSGAELE